MAVVFLAKATESGELDFGSRDNYARLHDYLKRNVGATFRLTLPKNKRSLSQNNYYWLYLGIIEQETGNSANDLHEYFKRTHLPPRFITVKVNDQVKEVKIPNSTTELDKNEMGDYLDKICAETGVPLPDPVAAGYIVG